MASLWACLAIRPHRRSQQWKAIKGTAAQRECQPSWDAPDNTLLLQSFEWHLPADQGHWTRLRDALSEFKAMGVGQIWLPPGCKGMDASGNGYDIYDLYDLGQFDQKGSCSTKWGSRNELEALVRQAHELNIAVFWDAVLNHKAGADYTEEFPAVEVDSQRRHVDISPPKKIVGWVGFDFPGRGDSYSAMKYHWQHFTGVDWDERQKKNAIYRMGAWAPDVSDELGNYDYLMFANLNLAHPAVRQDMLQWGTWITNTLSLGGMRLDAAKHMSIDFQRAFVDHVRQTSNPQLVVIGEYWSGDIQDLTKYLERMDYRVMAYDVPLLNKFHKLSHIPRADLRTIFRDTLVERHPSHTVTFVTNHDTQPGQMMDTPVAASFKLLAYALILLRQGGSPCLFYGDLYGIRQNVARPMVPACDGKLPLLAQLRKEFAYGEQQDYFDEPNCIGAASRKLSIDPIMISLADPAVGFIRYGNCRHPGLACVLSNAGPGRKRMYVGPGHAGELWTDLLSSSASEMRSPSTRILSSIPDWTLMFISRFPKQPKSQNVLSRWPH
ncbi:hypothetical protein FE257_007166 [Aspergillus nanangensis]|uniref:Glycosyl hydrolase family 13 catalytic domain-containing protein n=1 Tax=Aspergillus nanangensis TaxID=2582783 RepID=A0AAD4CNU0_ASPNN|nr:hypothetical protein FE257_007166 [Aspergillus nanangensis]